MAKAARLRYGQDMECPEIAEELGVKAQTVRSYFTEEEMEKFKRIFSDQEKFKLQRMLEQQIYDLEQEAKQHIRKGAKHPEASAADKIRAGKELMNIPKKKINLLQELSIVQKPKERKEVTENSGEVVFNEEVVESREELEDLENEAEVDASVEQD